MIFLKKAAFSTALVCLTFHLQNKLFTVEELAYQVVVNPYNGEQNHRRVRDLDVGILNIQTQLYETLAENFGVIRLKQS